MSAEANVNNQEFKAEVEEGVQPVIRNFVYDLRNRMIVSFNQPKTGKTYKRGKRGKVHRASAPGEPPAVDLGTLQNTIEAVFPSPTRGILSITAAHGLFLETGTERIAPRPFVVPAIKGALEQFT